MANPSLRNSSSFHFLPSTPIDKENDNGERGTGYDYSCDSMLQGLEVPIFQGEVTIQAPFSFQVAGHDPFLKAMNGLVCKPYAPRELWFYLQLEKYPHYKPFVADFLGCVEFTTEQIFESVLNAVGRRSSPPNPRPAESTGAASEESSQQLSITNSEEYLTPWAEKIHKGHLKRISDSHTITSESLHRYLVLRDVTYYCKRPCVMDLKIGVRAYGDDATDKKKASQILKSQQTTSSATGLRICGCQGYSKSQGDYWQLHKYEGRKLTKETLPLAFYRFFHNDESLQKDIIKQFIEDLYKILEVVKKKEFRLYSSSLLLVYDAVSETPKAHLAMIDFSHTFPTDSLEVDDGYIFGIETLLKMLQDLYDNDE